MSEAQGGNGRIRPKFFLESESTEATKPVASPTQEHLVNKPVVPDVTQTQPPSEEVGVIKNNEVIESVAQPVQSAVTPSTENEYYSKYMYLVGEGFISAYEVVSTADGEVPIKDYLTSDETLRVIVDAAKTQKLEEDSQSKIDISSLDEIRQNIIKVIVAGGDLNEAAAHYQNSETLLRGIDISTNEGKVEAIVLFYRGKGNDDDEIKFILDGLIAKGKVDEAAQRCYDALHKEESEKIAREAEKTEKAKKDAELQFKKLRTDIRNKLRNLNIAEGKSRTLIDKYITYTPKGDYVIDDIYFDKFNRPEELAELLLFFDNKEEYIRSMTANVVNEVKLQMAQKASQSGERSSGSMANTLNIVKPESRKPVTSEQTTQPVTPQQPPVQQPVLPKGGTRLFIPSEIPSKES